MFRLYKFKSAVVLQFPLPIPQHIPGENMLSQYYTNIINFNIRHTELKAEIVKPLAHEEGLLLLANAHRGLLVQSWSSPTHMQMPTSLRPSYIAKNTCLSTFTLPLRPTLQCVIASADPGVCIAASDTQPTFNSLTLCLVVPA